MPTTPNWVNQAQQAPKPQQGNAPKPGGVPAWVQNARPAGGNVSVAQPPNDPADIIKGMPNSDKLTASERWIYGKLPGFSESTIGKALAKFGDSWAGKALNVLDIGAEGLERTVGLYAQLSEASKTGEQLNP